MRFAWVTVTALSLFLECYCILPMNENLLHSTNQSIFLSAFNSIVFVFFLLFIIEKHSTSKFDENFLYVNSFFAFFSNNKDAIPWGSHFQRVGWYESLLMAPYIALISLFSLVLMRADSQNKIYYFLVPTQKYIDECANVKEKLQNIGVTNLV